MAASYFPAQSGTGTNLTGSAVTTISVTLNPITPGQAVCIFCGGFGNSAMPTMSVADNVTGNTYTFVDSAQDTTSSAWGACNTFYGLNINNFPTFLTATFSYGLAYAWILVDVFNGILTSGALDGFNTNFQTFPSTGADAITSGTFSPAHAGDLIWGCTIDEISSGTDVHGTGFTEGQYTGSGSYYSEYKLSGASGSQAVTFTNSTNAGSGWFLTGGFALRTAPFVYTPPRPATRYFPGYSILRP